MAIIVIAISAITIIIKAIPIDTSVSDETNELNQELFNAAKNGDIDQVKELVEKGADVNATNVALLGGATPLYFASSKGHLDIVQFFIDKGANVNVGSVLGMTPLMSASQEGHFDIVKFLIEKGADVNAVEKIFDSTALMCASQEGYFDIVKLGASQFLGTFSQQILPMITE